MRKSMVLLICIVTAPAGFAATDPACKPVIDADKARAAATAWHSRKKLGEMGIEMIRLGDAVYMNMGGSGWKRMPPAAAKATIDAGTQSASFDVSGCKKLGEEKVDGVATTLYSFTTTIKGQPPASGKVWIGNKDGLPYRELGDQHDGTTSYVGVTAPAVK